MLSGCQQNEGMAEKEIGKSVVKMSSEIKNAPIKAHYKGVCSQTEFRLQNRMSRVQVLLPLPRIKPHSDRSAVFLFILLSAVHCERPFLYDIKECVVDKNSDM